MCAVALLAVLAGCSGGLPGNDGTATEGTTADGVTTADASAIADRSWVDGGRVAFEALFERHAEVISSADSYQRETVVTSNGRTVNEVSFAANRGTERALLSISTMDGDVEQIQETYLADGRVYSKAGTAESPRYENQSFDSEFSRFVDRQSSLVADPAVVGQWEFEYVGREDGAYRFEADSVTAATDLPEGAIDLSNASEPNGTLVVDERGFVRELSVSATVERAGETVTFRNTVTYGGLNETTVSEPSWTDKA